jgi:hypothetical protein
MSLLLLAAIAVVATHVVPSQAAARRGHATHELPWTVSTRADPASSLEFTLALAQPKLGKQALSEAVLQRADPTNSALYGHWMTIAQVQSYVSAPLAAR